MTETKKTLAALLAEAPDNTTGLIDPEILRNEIVSTFGRYGGLRLDGNVTGLSLPASLTWYQFVQFDEDGPYDGVTPDHTNDHLTIEESGTYEIMISCSFTGTGGTTFELSAQKNNGASIVGNMRGESKLPSAGDIHRYQVSDIVVLNAADTIELWAQFTSTGISKSITITDINFYIRQVSGV